MVENVSQTKSRKTMSMWMQKTETTSCVQKNYTWNPSTCVCEMVSI